MPTEKDDILEELINLQLDVLFGSRAWVKQVRSRRVIINHTNLDGIEKHRAKKMAIDFGAKEVIFEVVTEDDQ